LIAAGFGDGDVEGGIGIVETLDIDSGRIHVEQGSTDGGPLGVSGVDGGQGGAVALQDDARVDDVRHREVGERDVQAQETGQCGAGHCGDEGAGFRSCADVGGDHTLGFQHADCFADTGPADL
jgi:hypothetical protein